MLANKQCGAYDKYQQVLYENLKPPTPADITPKDKYQQVLYENDFGFESFGEDEEININRCCTKTSSLSLPYIEQYR